MLLRPFLIPKGHYTKKKDHGLKNTLNSEGTKKMKRKKSPQHKSKEGGIEKKSI